MVVKEVLPIRWELASRLWQGGGMAADSHRSVTITRTSLGRYAAVNSRGSTLEFGTGAVDDFTPVDLFLTAIGGCTAADVDTLTTRRAEPESFAVEVHGEKVRDEGGNRMEELTVTFRLKFPEGEGGDAARALLPDAVKRSHDRLCTVSRSVELGTAIETRIEP
jgi:putative redox protein